MKKVENILDSLCVISTIIFFLSVAVLIFVQAFAVITMNGPLSVSISNAIAEPASIVSAVATITAIVLGYMRKQL